MARHPGYRRVVADATGDATLAASYTPDVALVNHYADAAKMGMHRDADERSDAPVVSLSIGDTCRFRFSNATTRNRPYTDVWLQLPGTSSSSVGPHGATTTV